MSVTVICIWMGDTYNDELCCLSDHLLAHLNDPVALLHVVVTLVCCVVPRRLDVLGHSSRLKDSTAFGCKGHRRYIAYVVADIPITMITVIRLYIRTMSKQVV